MSDLLTHYVIDGTFYILMIFSVLTWTLILFKIWQFVSNNRRNKAFNEVFWNTDNLAHAKGLPDEVFKGTQSHLAHEGFIWLDEFQRIGGKSFKYAGNPNELLEQTLRDKLQKEQHTLESGLTLLASIGSTAPFVGLFGTVMGIMHAMHDITASGSTSLDVVAGPIGDALVATAIGIAVAVPAVLAYNFFLRRVKLQRQQLESFVARFLLATDLSKV